MTAWLSPSAAQSGAKWKRWSLVREAGEEMRVLEARHGVDPAFAQHRRGIRPARRAQRRVDDLHRRHLEAGMLGAQPRCQALQYLVVRAALAGRLDQLRADLDVAVPAGLVQIVVLHEHRCRQHDVGPARRLRHELLVRADEQVVAREAAAHAVAVRADRQRVLVLDEQGVHLRARRPARAGRRSARCRSGSCRVRGSTGRARRGLRSASCPNGTCRGSTTTRRRPRAARRR